MSENRSVCPYSVTDDCVMRAKAMVNLKKASTRNYTSVYNWMHHNGPLLGAESKIINHDEDFVALVDAKEGSWLDGFIEDCLSMFRCRLTSVRKASLDCTQILRSHTRYSSCSQPPSSAPAPQTS